MDSEGPDRPSPRSAGRGAASAWSRTSRSPGSPRRAPAPRPAGWACPARGRPEARRTTPSGPAGVVLEAAAGNVGVLLCLELQVAVPDEAVALEPKHRVDPAFGDGKCHGLDGGDANAGLTLADEGKKALPLALEEHLDRPVGLHEGRLPFRESRRARRSSHRPGTGQVRSKSGRLGVGPALTEHDGVERFRPGCSDAGVHAERLKTGRPRRRPADRQHFLAPDRHTSRAPRSAALRRTPRRPRGPRAGRPRARLSRD